VFKHAKNGTVVLATVESDASHASLRDASVFSGGSPALKSRPKFI